MVLPKLVESLGELIIFLVIAGILIFFVVFVFKPEILKTAAVFLFGSFDRWIGIFG